MCAVAGWGRHPVNLSVPTGWNVPQADAAQEGGVVGHADGGVLVHHTDGDLLARAQQAHPGRVARVELALARLDAASAAQERRLVHHHLITCNVREVQVIYLAGHTDTQAHIHTNTQTHKHTNTPYQTDNKESLKKEF